MSELYWLKDCPWCKTCGRDPCVCGPIARGIGNDVHDRTMIAALDGVHFGRFNSKERFLAGISTTGVRTSLQRWWLTTLVITYRKQVKSDLAIAMAETWLANNPEPK